MLCTDAVLIEMKGKLIRKLPKEEGVRKSMLIFRNDFHYVC